MNSNFFSNQKKQNGFTLLDVLVGTSLMLIVFMGIFGAFQTGLELIGTSKGKITATAIANGEIEQVRNMPYEDIGIVGGFPDGALEEEVEIVQNGVVFTVARRVDYVIDPADGIANPLDSCPNDYKKVEIRVTSSGQFNIDVSMVTNIGPKNLVQECADEGGILGVTVFNALGVPIISPLIEIKDPSDSSTITTATPFEGMHYFSLPAGTYRVEVSKTGFSSDKTYSIEEVTAPQNPNPIVLEEELVEISFSIDELSSFSIETLSDSGEEFFPVPNVTFNIRGEKIIGYDEDEEPVYKYSEEYTTNTEGVVSISSLEWDKYFFTLISPSSLNLINTDPTPQPIDLLPSLPTSVDLFLESENTLLVTVLEEGTLVPVFSADVDLSNDTYDESQFTNAFGQTYFIPLTAEDYDLYVSAPGYSSESAMVSVSGEETITIELERIE